MQYNLRFIYKTSRLIFFLIQYNVQKIYYILLYIFTLSNSRVLNE